jgi:Holliday junction resolvase
MAQRESRRSKEILKDLRVAGAFCFKVWGSEHMMVGLPDIIGCYRGHFFGFEVKHPETVADTSEKQEYVMELIRRAGGTSQVITSSTQALQALRRALHE